MGFGRINVWIHERKTCGIAAVAGSYSVSLCCGRVIREGKFEGGHADITDVPPGCYIVTVQLKKPLTLVLEIMVTVTCDKSACVNFVLPEK
jgi:hypothetical protein